MDKYGHSSNLATHIECMDFFDVIRTRRSIRKYVEKPIPSDDLKKILEAAQLAPSAVNSQPWCFIVVKENKMKEFLAKSVGEQSFVSKAGAVIVVLGDPEIAPYWHMMDSMIAAEHLVLAATALGYGTCLIGALGDWVPENTDSVKKELNIPEKLSIVCLLTIGVPDERPRPRPRKRLEEICFSDMYGKPMKFG